MASPAKNANFLQSLKNALTGIKTTIKYERNIKIHLVICVLVVIAGFIFKVNPLEWLALVLCMGTVLGMEHINTAIENVVDLAANKEYHILAKRAKDASAGAVLILSVMSVVIGMIIFIPKLWNLFLLLIR